MNAAKTQISAKAVKTKVHWLYSRVPIFRQAASSLRFMAMFHHVSLFAGILSPWVLWPWWLRPCRKASWPSHVVPCLSQQKSFGIIYQSTSLWSTCHEDFSSPTVFFNWGSIPTAKAKAKAVPKKRHCLESEQWNPWTQRNCDWRFDGIWGVGYDEICAARTSREEPSRRATREGEAEDEVKHTKLFISFVYFLLILWIILHTMIYNVCKIYMNSYYYNCIFCHYPSLFSIKWMLRCFLPPTWPGLRSRRDLFASGPLIADLPSGM